MIKPSIYAPYWGQDEIENFEFSFKQYISISYDTLQFDPAAAFKVFIQFEPTGISGNMNNLIIQNQHSFDLILTYKKNVLDACKNATFFSHAGCWINNEDQEIHKKNKLISIIASGKNRTSGHQLRHKVINEYKIIDCYGYGYNPVKNKITALKDYMFSMTIENSIEDNYFTEKLIDCIMTGAVPIYWGCKNIGDFFDTRGMIVFSDEVQLPKIMDTLSEETYNKMKPHIEHNFNIAKAKRYTVYDHRITEIINTFIKSQSKQK